jgi:hypothetical protein
LENFDILKQFGRNTAVSKQFTASVDNENGLIVSFKAKKDTTVLNGIIVRKVY